MKKPSLIIVLILLWHFRSWEQLKSGNQLDPPVAPSGQSLTLNVKHTILEESVHSQDPEALVWVRWTIGEPSVNDRHHRFHFSATLFSLWCYITLIFLISNLIHFIAHFLLCHRPSCAGEIIWRGPTDAIDQSRVSLSCQSWCLPYFYIIK